MKYAKEKQVANSQWSLHLKMADHENIVKHRLNLPLSRSNLLLFLSRCFDTVWYSWFI